MRENNKAVGAWEVGDYIVCNACEMHTPLLCVSIDVGIALEGRRAAIPEEELEDTWGVVGLNCDACGCVIVKPDEPEDEVGL